MSLEADESALNAGAPELPDAEVKRRLRIRNQPICYFGETAEDRIERLKNLEKSGGEIDYNSVENVQSGRDKEFQKIAKAKQQNQEEEAELQKEKSNFDNLTPTQRRLLELRLKLNEGRKQNLEELVGEQKENGSKKGDKKFYKNKKRIREEENSIAITAEQAEYISKKKQKKAQPNFEGAEARGQDALYKAYSKRAKAIPDALAITDEIIKTKHIDDQEDIEELNKERMANELLESINKRQKFSRRRTYREDEDAGHINSANRHFNKKLSRAFDKHTTEIKQNLERGTAV